MAITYDDILAEVRIALRGDLGANISADRFVQRVGRRWVTAHQWAYLDGRRSSITTVPRQVEYVLPRDLAEIRFIGRSEYLAAAVRIVDWRKFEFAQNGPGGVGFAQFVGAVNYQQKDGESVPVLSLTPTPTAETTLDVVYRAGWKPLVKKDDVADIPVWGEEAFLTLVRAVATGLSSPSDDGSPDPTEALVARALASPSMMAAKEADGLAQPRLVPGCGAVEREMKRNRRYDPRQRWTDQDLRGLL